MANWKSVFVSVFLAILMGAGMAHAEGRVMTVKGKVGFERRMTLIPLAVCEDDTCPRSEPYWVLVLEQGGIRYELNTVFGRGSERPPESVELAGVIIRQGSRVLLDGHVQRMSPSYALIVDVLRASLLMDNEIEEGESLLPAPLIAVGGRSMLIWKCRSLRDAGPEKIQAEVWRKNEGKMEIRILSSAEGQTRQMDSFNVNTGLDHSTVTFEGSTDVSSVSLTVRPESNPFAAVPATLEYSRMDETLTPIRFFLDVVCDSGPVYQ